MASSVGRAEDVYDVLVIDARGLDEAHMASIEAVCGLIARWCAAMDIVTGPKSFVVDGDRKAVSGSL